MHPIFVSALHLRGPRRGRWARQAALAAVWCALAAQAGAQTVVPPGAVIDMSGGSWVMACTDVIVGGTLILGPGSAMPVLKNFTIQPGGVVDISGATLTLAERWINQGSVINTGGGQVTRVDDPACAAQGPLGPLNPNTGAAAGAGAQVTAVPTTGAGALGLLVLALGWLGARARRRRAAA